MRFQFLALWASVGVVLALLGCSAVRSGSVALPPTPSGAEGLFSAEEIESARSLCLNKCAKCHKFYDPAKYDDAEWNTWMRKMNKKAKLKEAQAELLGRYLDTFRKPTGTNSNALGAAR